MKKRVIGLLTLIFVMSGILFFGTKENKVLAADGNVTPKTGFISVEYNDLAGFRGDNKKIAPEAPSNYENYIFAGWYKDVDCTQAYSNVTADATLAYAKFVPENVLSVKVQLKADATKDSEKTNMRLVSSVDSLRYKNVGYEIYYDGSETPIPLNATKVFKRIVASETSGVDYNYSAKVVDVESEYFVTATLLNIKNDNFDKTFYIKPYWTTLDGTIVYGVSKHVTVSNGLDKSNVNLTVNVGEGFDTTNMQVTIGGETYPATLAYYDGKYAHLNVTINDVDTVLKSVNAVSVTDGTITASTEYRNLYTKYAGDGIGDKSWYKASASEYIIAASADLYGFASIVNGGTTFGGKTVYVIADIEVNKGRATESGWSTLAEDGSAIKDATSHVWTPIGFEGKAFSGVFDGQGHTISGVNGTPTTTVAEAYYGLFGLIGTGGELKNFRLTNSYFGERAAASGQTNYTGSIAGRTNGNISSVYSDAYVRAYSPMTGGILGRAHGSTAKTISNCWYAGKIIVSGSTANRTGGIVGQQWAGTLLLENCLFSGELSFSGVTGNIKTGGFAGHSVTGLTIKNSLNSGKFINVDSASVTATGRILGHNEAAVMIENVYATKVGDSTAAWYNPGGLATGSEDPTLLEEADITGVHAYCNDILVKSDEWVMSETTPELALFSDGLALPGNIDWYTSKDATEYTICDNEDNEENVKDLYGFAYLVNAGIDFSKKTVKMANDVVVNADTPDTNAEWTTYLAENADAKEWTPIGTDTNEFAGIFDGQMHSIKGIYVDTSEKGVGLFGLTANGSEIKNLKLENSYINTTSGYAGSIVGSASGNLTNVYSNAIVKVTSSQKLGAVGGLVAEINGTGTMNLKQCWFDGSVINTYASTGGIVGIVAQGKVYMTNCLNTGNLTGATNSVGGLCSRTFRSTEKLTMNGTAVSSLELHITDSMNAGNILSNVGWSGSVIGRIQHLTSGMTCTNVYATNESCLVSGVATPIGNGSLATTSEPVHMVVASSIEGLKSHYNNILVSLDAWVPTDKVPAPKVFTEGLLTESTEEINIDWFTGLDTLEYTICDEDTNEANVAELYGFAYLANHGIDFAGMTVTMAKDVTINTEAKVWTPIATIAKPFAGTFDGGLHSISGIHVTANSDGIGLFGATTAGSTIKNIKVLNSYFENTANNTGSIVGLCEGSLVNAYSDATVKSKIYTGGLIGRIYTKSTEEITLSNCWFAGNVQSSNNQIGGIVGAVDGGTVKMTNCLNTADIVCNGAKSAFNGGLCGGMTEETGYVVDVTMSNCLNVGRLTNCNTASDSFVGAILGRKNGNAAVTLKNVYATNESYSKAIGGTNIPSGSVMVDESAITGRNAYYNNILVDEEAWVATTQTPELAIFSTLKLEELPKDVDVSWYKGVGTTTYTICDEDTNEANVAELKGFAYLVNDGVTFDGMSVQLGNDVTINEGEVSEWNTATGEGLTVWTPIGTDTNEFAGTFDGQMHSIKGIYVNSSELGAGLFKHTADGSTIKNLKLENSYITSTKNIVGSIVGNCGGNIENVYSNATINANVLYVGGIVGQVYSNGNVSIKNCWYDGALSAQSNAAGIVGVITKGIISIEKCLNSGNISIGTNKDTAGGLVARTYRSTTEWGLDGASTATVPSTTIKNSLNSGTITGRNNIGSAIGWPQRGTLTIENVYATKSSDGATHDNIGIGNDSTDTRIIMVDVDAITGRNAYYNNILVNEEAWVATEKTPELAIFSKSKLEIEEIPSGVDISWYQGVGTTTYTICDEITNEANVAELNGLAYLVNKGMTFEGITVKLGNDVTVNDGAVSTWNTTTGEGLVAWTPIGTSETPFVGIFDGQLHSISGLYATATTNELGLFGATATGSTVQNVKVLNSYFKNTANYTGSIVGKAAGYVKNVYSDATVVGEQYTGGLIGYIYDTSMKNIEISNSWFAGTVTASHVNLGGLIGAIDFGLVRITDCLNSATVTGSGKNFTGGLIGGMTASTTGDANVTMTRCFNVGKVNNGTNAWTGAIIGRKNGLAILALENVYGTSESHANAVGNGSPTGIYGLVDESKALGQEAYYNLNSFGFDEESNWVLVEGATPQLKLFADGAAILESPEIGENVNIAWYNGSTSTYTIKTAEELYGFAYLGNLGITFANKTVRLGADIDLNEGWTASESPEEATKWSPIGTDTKPFEGIFDGQGHSISGVYVDDTIAYMGFFGVTGYNSEIKNFRLVNSYFNQQATSGDGYTGSVAGELRGSMSNVYSNAIVKSGNIQIGGMVARTKTNASFTTTVNIKDCWFDGKVIGGTTGRYLGGIVAATVRGTCNIENVLFTGVIDTDHNDSENAVYAGGIIADGKANSTVINLKSVISAGQIIGENSGNLVHAVIGRVRTVEVSNSGTTNATAQKPVVTFENVFATRKCRNTAYSVGSVKEGILIVEGEEVPITSEVLVTGGVFFTSGEDRLIGTGTQEVAEGSVPALDFTNAWCMRTDGIPVPKKLSDMAEENTVVANYDVVAFAKEIGLDYWNANASIKDAVAYGAGNYLVSYTTGSSTYAGYISKLGTLGFTKYADNSGTDMEADGIVSGTYYKEATATTGEWVLNITSVANESKIYISIGTDIKALDDNLKSVAQEGNNAISLSMLEMVNTQDVDPYGNSFVFQLPNGHFIVSDGGRYEDGLKLVEFLRGQVGTGNDVIIDAWVITHYHDDHCGALNIFADNSSLRNGIYVEAIYACEPSSYALDYWTSQLGVMNKALNGAMTLTKKSDGTRPDVYQMHMGQRYYFNGITMDVIDTQEQHPVATWGGTNPEAFPDEFNTSSTNCVFTFTDKAGTTKKVLVGGDATTVNMEYIMDVYGASNKALSNIDVFAAYHHGHNMTATYGEMTVSTKYSGINVEASANGEANKDWTNFLLNNNNDNKFDVVLFSYNHVYRANLTYSGSAINGGRNYYYKGTDGNVIYPYNIGEINDDMINRSIAAYTYENGTVKITFDGNNTTKVFGKGVFSE